MREILFRGQTRKYGEKVNAFTHEELPGKWVYGGVLQGVSAHSIIYGYDNEQMTGEINKFPVYTETLGQYTGLTDKNGKKIFEGDIVKAKLESGNFKGFEWPNMKVGFKDGAFCLIDNIGRIFAVMGAFVPNVNFEVVGNFYDNSELLEVK